MSYSNVFYPSQSYAYSHVGGKPMDKTDSNINYIKNQSKIIADQGQTSMGKMPNYVDPTLSMAIINAIGNGFYIPRITNNNDNQSLNYVDCCRITT